MKTSITRRLQTFVTNGHYLLVVGIFLAVLGSRLWLIQNDGNDVPVGDQWDAEAAKVYKPMLEHGFGAVDWFASHNEHRVVLTKLTAAAMLVVNGQWDPLLQESWEAICAAMIAALMSVSLIRLMPGNRALGLVFGLTVIGFTMPYGWENTLQGFQSQFYYLLLLAMAMFHLCAYRGLLTTRRSILIGVLGLLSLGTLASGAIACLAAACVLMVRLAVARQSDTRRVVGLVVALILLMLIGFGTTPQIPAHLVLHAQSFSQFLEVFSILLGWPSPLGFLVWLPFAAWCIQSVAKRKVESAGFFLVGFAAFVLLNAAATAVGRGNTIPDIAAVASRYTDLVWQGWLVNLIAAILLVKNRNDDRSTGGRRAFLMLIFFAAGVLLWDAGLTSLAGATQRGAYYGIESGNARIYVATANPAALRDKPPGHIPYGDPNLLMQWLNDPTIRPLLPPGIRQGILARSGATADSLASLGFVRAEGAPGIPLAPAPQLGDFFGTWGKEDGNKHTAKFVSAPIQAQAPTVQLQVYGYLGRPGLSLYLEDVVSSKRIDLVPDQASVGKWTSVRATIPGPVYRLVAEDAATGDEGWFAFTDPVESGRLRSFVEFLIRIGKGMTLVGLALFLASVLAPPWRRDTAVEAV